MSHLFRCVFTYHTQFMFTIYTKLINTSDISQCKLHKRTHNKAFLCYILSAPSIDTQNMHTHILCAHKYVKTMLHVCTPEP